MPMKNENSGIFHISAQIIDCGYSLEPPQRGGSNEYPQSMFLSRNKKINVYPCKSQFYCVNDEFKGVKSCFRHDKNLHWAHLESPRMHSFFMQTMITLHEYDD